MGTFQEGAATFERGASCPGELRGGSTHDFLPRLMPESFHPSSLPDRPVIRRGKASSDGCRPPGCRAQEVARLLLCACLLCLGKTGAAAPLRSAHEGTSCGRFGHRVFFMPSLGSLWEPVTSTKEARTRRGWSSVVGASVHHFSVAD